MNETFPQTGVELLWSDIVALDLRADCSEDLVREVTRDGASFGASITEFGGGVRYWRADGSGGFELVGHALSSGAETVHLNESTRPAAANSSPDGSRWSHDQHRSRHRRPRLHGAVRSPMSRPSWILSLCLLAFAPTLVRADAPRLIVFESLSVDPDGSGRVVFPQQVHLIDQDDRVYSSFEPSSTVTVFDFKVDQRGRVIVAAAGAGVNILSEEWDPLVAPWARVGTVTAVGLGPREQVYVLRNAFFPPELNGLRGIEPDGSHELVASAWPSGAWHAADQALAGPFAGGFLAVGYELDDRGRRASADWFLQAVEVLEDGSVVEHEALGPLGGLEDWRDCLEVFPAYHRLEVSVRTDGESLLVADTCTSQIHEYGLDGNHLGLFVQAESDRFVDVFWDRDAPPGSTAPDRIRRIHVTPDDHLYVLFSRGLVHYDPSGTLVGEVDLGIRADAWSIGDGDHVPIERGECAPRSIGWWKRQCLGADGSHAASGSLPGVGIERGPGAHPHLSAEDFAALRDRADARLADHGVGACDVLRGPVRGDAHRQALAGLAAAHLNQAAKRLHGGCLVSFGGSERTAREVLDEIHDLLERGDRAAARRAAQLARALGTARVREPEDSEGGDE